jgi:hypothetical protein
MELRNLLLLAGTALLSAVSIEATPIAVNFVNAETPSPTTTQALPFLLDINNQALFLRFKLPDVSLINAIDSITVNVRVFDDGDRGGETGQTEFALPSSPNQVLVFFFPNINGTTQASPLPLSNTITDPTLLAQIIPSLADGNLRIRVVRDSGSFNVLDGSVTIDANVPEPAAISSFAGGLFVIAGLVRRRFKR